MRVEVDFDEGEYYVTTDEDAWKHAKAFDSAVLYEQFLERCVVITEEEDAEWKRLYDLKLQANREYVNYISKMGKPGFPAAEEKPPVIVPSIDYPIDPELERLLAEEEEIAKMDACMKHHGGFSCVKRGTHDTHQDVFGGQWTDTDGLIRRRNT